MSLLEARELAPLRRAVPASWIVRAVSLADARTELSHKPGGVYLFNPADIGTDALQAFAADSKGAGARIVLYGADGLDARALIELITCAHVEVVAPGSDGRAVSIRSVIAMPRTSHAVQALRAIGPQILTMPSHCAIPCARLFTFLPLPTRASDFYTSVGRSQAVVGRYLRDAALCAPLQLLNVARTARLLHILRAGGTEPPTELARLTGFASAESMREVVRTLLDTTISELERKTSLDHLTRRLVEAARAIGNACS